LEFTKINWTDYAEFGEEVFPPNFAASVIQVFRDFLRFSRRKISGQRKVFDWRKQ
jgi:hypothetical protein